MGTKWQTVRPVLRWPALLAVIAIAVLAVAFNWPSAATAEPGTDPGTGTAAARPPLPAPADNEFFLKIDGVEGESTAAGHQGELDLLSWSWGVTIDAPSNPTLPVVGRPKFTDVTFATHTSKASPNLMLACAQGKHFKSAVLTVRKANAAGENEQPYLKITLNDVLVSSFQQSGSNASELPTEQFTLTFAQIIMEYRQQNADGSLGTPIRTGWDLARNRAI